METVRSVLMPIVGALIAGCGLSAGSAATSTANVQTPGYYRMQLGDFEVVALNDGVVEYTAATVLPEASPEQIRTSLYEAALSDPFGMSYNAYLINTGDKLVLIDTGTGGKLADSPYFGGAGRLFANLGAAGYRPEDVDEVYITHVGPDHIGGLTLGTERTFPNAVVRAARQEVEGFLGPSETRVGDESVLQFRASLFEPYIEAGRFETFEEDVVLVPGIRALATHGHTPGHTSYVVESRGETLIVLGDLILMSAMQFAEPSLTSGFDADREAAAVQRERILQMAADNDYWVAGAHLSFPGIGHVRSAQKGYAWVPANYAIPR